MTYASRWYTDDPNEAEPDERPRCRVCGEVLDEGEVADGRCEGDCREEEPRCPSCGEAVRVVYRAPVLQDVERWERTAEGWRVVEYAPSEVDVEGAMSAARLECRGGCTWQGADEVGPDEFTLETLAAGEEPI